MPYRTLYSPPMNSRSREDIRRALGVVTDPAVKSLDVELGPDSSGEDAVFVTITFFDARLNEGWRRSEGLRAEIYTKLRELVPDLWPFVRFSAETVAAFPDEALVG